MANLKKKLIEVALPLKEINEESAREKSIRHGHPSTLHLWWARRPLAACRAVLFASLVDDPSSHPDKFPTEEAQQRERERLFAILRELVKWENSNNEYVLEQARKEILRSTGGHPPPVLDPFCGGGSIPLEAQRLGLEAHGSDLNPVAVLITKALIEIPPKFRDQPPVNPEARGKIGGGQNWRGATGLAEDVRYYGRWMREEAWKRIGHLYPKVKLPAEQGGGEATVIAWLWARTVKCPNPACGAQMPLVRSFVLSTKQKVWVEPVIDARAKTVRYLVKTGEEEPPVPPKIGRGAKFKCLVCGQLAEDQHIKDEGSSRRMRAQLMAVVATGNGNRIYLSPTSIEAKIASSAKPVWQPDQDLPFDPRNIWCTKYGLTTFADLFTPRQLVALTTFSDLVGEARERVLADGGSEQYANAVVTYLGLSVSRLANRSSTICFWDATRGNVQQVFARQAIPMTWDYVESNPFSDSTGNFLGQLSYVIRMMKVLPRGQASGECRQFDSSSAGNRVVGGIVATDPPYYDNIGYADLSDFFYVWLRRSLKNIYPDLFRTMLTPKTEELVATPYRFGGDKKKAEQFFEEGLRQAFQRMHEAHHPDYPLALFYAFKQAEKRTEGIGEGENLLLLASTGWETMLEGLLDAGFQITGTWPMRTELVTNLKKGVGALASSIVLVCRPRPADAPKVSRMEFYRALRKELPGALHTLQHGNIAPVDLAQAAIGPGIAVFSRYGAVLEADGSRVRVRMALGLINRVLDEVLAEQESEFDPDTRWALAWFEQFGHEEGDFGDAETLSKAKDVSVAGLEEAGILVSRGGRVRLLRREDLPEDWDPLTDERLTVWELTQQLILALKRSESDAAALVKKAGAISEAARDLAYRLYTICDRKKWAAEAFDYNALVVAWPEITRQASQQSVTGTPGELYE